MPAGTAGAAVTEANPTVRIGLFYGTSALAGGNLLNSTGTGYRLGYYDSSRSFVQLGATTQTAISVVKTQNVYYGTVGSWSGYYDSISSGVAVGCYHLLLPGTYSDFWSAQAAAGQYPGGFPAWIDGVYQVRIGAYLDSASAQAAQTALGLSGAEVVGTSSYGVSVVATETNTILFQFDSSNNSLCLGVMPGLDDTVKTETIFRGNVYYGGFQYQRTGGGNLTISNVLPMEDYIQGVIIHEMSPTWPLEALKAQAVCARSYAAFHAGKHSSQGFDLCNTTECQVYSGIAELSETSRQAVEETYGQYVFCNGALAETLYFSCDGGATESAVNVWGSDVPYLIGKADPYEAAVADRTGKYNWTVTYTAQELTNLLNSKGYMNTGIVNMYASETTPTGNVKTLTFTDSSGKNFSFTPDRARTLLGLSSIRYTINGMGSVDTSTAGGSYSVAGGGTLSSVTGAYAVGGDGIAAPITGNAYVITGQGTEPLATSAGGSTTAPITPSGGSGTYTITGSGYGHNVGMSQWGAYAMAQAGYTYRDILQFYYTGIEVRQP